jgi:hypothetical protein
LEIGKSNRRLHMPWLILAEGQVPAGPGWLRLLLSLIVSVALLLALAVLPHPW